MRKKEKPWLLVGLGVSNLGAAKLINKRQEHFEYTSDEKIPKETSRQLEKLGGKLKQNKDFEPTKYKGIITSPGIPPSHPIISKAKGRTFVGTEIDYALRNTAKDLKAIYVTGTNGKSTVTAMITHLLNQNGHSATSCGNFGLPVSEALLNNPKSLLVIEISSYQIEYLSTPISGVAVITTLSPDHLTRHGNYEGYVRTKLKICSNQNHLTVVTTTKVKKTAETICKKSFFLEDDSETVSHSSWRVCLIDCKENDPLESNKSLSKAALKEYLGENLSSFNLSFESFVPLPYRFQEFRSRKGRLIINDSKSTNLESTEAAIIKMKEPFILALGGQSKGESFDKLVKHNKKLIAVCLFGESADKIAEDLKDLPAQKVRKFITLQDLLSSFEEMCLPKNAPFLFSPGCASFDEFKNFIVRGEFVFRHFAQQPQDQA